MAVSAGWLLAGAALLGAVIVLRGGEEEPPTVRVPAAPPPVVSADTLEPGQTLAGLLASAGMPAREAARVVDRIREFESPRRLQPGLAVRFVTDFDAELPRSIALRLDADRTITLERRSDGWGARLDSVAVTRDTIAVAGRIRSSLYGARLAGDTALLAPGERGEIAYELSRIFQWQIDFFRDLRAGDAFRVAITRQVRPDGTLRSAQVLGAEFVNGDRTLRAIWLGADEPTVRGYYDEDGNSLQTMFLRAPLDFPVTSGFSRRRYHPVLHRWRAHRGIDYGAPYGRAVRATGAGVVTRAGTWGGYGRMVEVRHSGRFRTRYAHLSRVGVRPGERVAQGEVIGRVGATGLATGSHLHYEFLVNGQQRNPATLDLPPGDPVPRAYLPAFRSNRKQVLQHLVSVPVPTPSRVADLRRVDADGDG